MGAAARCREREKECKHEHFAEPDEEGEGTKTWVQWLAAGKGKKNVNMSTLQNLTKKEKEQQHGCSGSLLEKEDEVWYDRGQKVENRVQKRKRIRK